jgi:hypothetical protein
MKHSLLNEVISEGKGKGLGSSFGSFLHGKSKLRGIKEGLTGTTLAGNLTSFMIKSPEVCGDVTDLKKILFKHFKKGEYDSPLAERAWSRVVQGAAKKYTTEVISEQRLWEELFSVDVIQSVVELLEQEFYTNLKKGKVDIEELFNE